MSAYSKVEIFEQRLEKQERANHVEIWEKRFLGRGNSMFKGLRWE